MKKEKNQQKKTVLYVYLMIVYEKHIECNFRSQGREISKWIAKNGNSFKTN